MKPRNDNKTHHNLSLATWTSQHMHASWFGGRVHYTYVFLVLLLPMVQECSAACYELLCMQMEAPCLADSLRGPYGVSCNTRAVDAPDISSGWQQSKLIWALSAEVGQASRIPCDILWHV